MRCGSYLCQVSCDASDIDLLCDLARSFGSGKIQKFAGEGSWGAKNPTRVLKVQFDDFGRAHTFCEVVRTFQATEELRDVSLMAVVDEKLKDDPVDVELYKLREYIGIYVIEAVDSGGIYRIGSSLNFTRTVLQDQAGCPFELRLSLFIPCSCKNQVRELESQIRVHFADKWLKGEWFRLTEDDVIYLSAASERQYKELPPYLLPQRRQHE